MRSSKVKLVLLLAIIVVLLFAPTFVDPFTMIMMIRFMYFGLMTVAFSFLASQLGLISLMVPVFYSIVAYVIAIFQTRDIMPVEAAVGVAFLIAMSVAALTGIMVNRTKRITFLMLTLVLAQLVWAIAMQWTDLTNGVDGLVGINFPQWLNIFSDRPNVNEFYWIFIGFAIVAALVWLLTKSPYGLILRGIRESETRMKALGYNTALYKWTAFMIAAFVSSVGGLFYIYYLGFVSPEVLTLGASNQALISSILGGMQSVVAGSVLGTVIYLTLDLVLSGIITRYQTIVGFLFLFVILFAPKGLMSLHESTAVGRKIHGFLIKKLRRVNDGKSAGTDS